MIVYVPMSAEVEAYRNNRQISLDETALMEIAKNHGEMTFSLTPALAASKEPIDQPLFRYRRALDGVRSRRGGAIPERATGQPF